LAAGCASSDKRATSTDQPTATTEAPVTTEDAGFPDESIPEATPPEVAKLKVGDTAELSAVDTDDAVIRVLVDKAEAIRSEPYNKPTRGWFLGVHVKVKALADEQSSLWGDFYVLMRGHHYDPDAYAERWSPTLDYVDLHKGETSEGWLVFDVPARHGQVVLGQSDGSGGKVATWSF